MPIKGIPEEDVQVGKFYTNEATIREIIRETKDGILWRSYEMDGRPAGATPGACSRNRILVWATREATSEEIAGLQRQDAQAQEDEFFTDMIEQMLRRIPDELLLAEVNRRFQKRASGSQAGGMAMVYGSLYMDQMESFEFAETQVDECLETLAKPMSQAVLVFDLVATSEQIEKQAAHNTARYILNYVDSRYPDLHSRVVGITDDEKRRPGRDILVTSTLRLSDIDNVHLFTLE